MGIRNAYLIIYGRLKFSDLKDYEIEPTREALIQLGYDENDSNIWS